MNIVKIDFDSAVSTEEQAQLDQWKEQNHPDGTGPENKILADAARESCEHAAANGHLTWKDILLEEMFEAFAEEDEEALIAELIQSAAVIKSWIKAIQRRHRLVAV